MVILSLPQKQFLGNEKEFSERTVQIAAQLVQDIGYPYDGRADNTNFLHYHNVYKWGNQYDR